MPDPKTSLQMPADMLPVHGTHPQSDTPSRAMTSSAPTIAPPGYVPPPPIRKRRTKNWWRWSPMAEFDPSKPAQVHDRLNDQTIDWKPDQHQANYEMHSRQLEGGMVAWDGLLLDGWRPR